MDEPTSSLTQTDAERLFVVIDALRARDVSIVYISHFLEECQRICQRYTVLRDGETVGTGEMRNVGAPEIIRMMVGREIQEIYPRSPHSIGKPVLEVCALGGRNKPRSASFTLRQGEILGIAGLIGSGRTETVRACFGLDRLERGTVVVFGGVNVEATPAQRLSEGIGLLSENRKEEGLMLNLDIADNLTLTRLNPFSLNGFLYNNRQWRTAAEWIQKLNIRARSPKQAVLELSGGNQQKVALGRLLHHDAKIFLLDEPTRGIDVGSKAQIYKWMTELADAGRSILFISSYLPELLGVCDTIAVMCRGVITDLRPVSEWTEHSIMSAAIGQSGSAAGSEA